MGFYFFLVLLQKAQVYNLIPAPVLSALLKESLLLLFKKRKLSTCNWNIHTQPTLKFNFSVFSHAVSGWKSAVCFGFFLFCLLCILEIHGDVLPSHRRAERGHTLPCPSTPGNYHLRIQPKLEPIHFLVHLLFKMLTLKVTEIPRYFRIIILVLISFCIWGP